MAGLGIDSRDAAQPSRWQVITVDGGGALGTVWAAELKRQLLAGLETLGKPDGTLPKPQNIVGTSFGIGKTVSWRYRARLINIGPSRRTAVAKGYWWLDQRSLVRDTPATKYGGADTFDAALILTRELFASRSFGANWFTAYHRAVQEIRPIWVRLELELRIRQETKEDSESAVTLELSVVLTLRLVQKFAAYLTCGPATESSLSFARAFGGRLAEAHKHIQKEHSRNGHLAGEPREPGATNDLRSFTGVAYHPVRGSRARGPTEPPTHTCSHSLIPCVTLSF